MKKIFVLLFCLVMIVSMVGCAADKSETTAATTETPAAKGDTMSLMEILEGIYEGYTGEMPEIVNMQIDNAEAFEMFAFTNSEIGYEAAVSEPMIGSIAHSVVLVRVPEGTDVEAVRSAIEENHNPRKWVCVKAEKTAVIAHNNTIMLVMTSAELADIVIANFDALWA